MTTAQEIARRVLARILEEFSGDVRGLEDLALPIIAEVIEDGMREAETRGIVMGVRHAADTSEAVEKIFSNIFTLFPGRRDP